MRKQFGSEDLWKFARLSGDANPIHTNREISRRLLFGAPVVHGLNLVLWGWDEVAKTLTGTWQLCDLCAVFSQPILEGEDAYADVEIEGSSAEVTVQGLSGKAAVIQFSWARAVLPNISIPESYPDIVCRDLSFDEAAMAEGEFITALDPELLAQLAPNVARSFSKRMSH